MVGLFLDSVLFRSFSQQERGPRLNSPFSPLITVSLEAEQVLREVVNLVNLKSSAVNTVLFIYINC